MGNKYSSVGCMLNVGDRPKNPNRGCILDLEISVWSIIVLDFLFVDRSWCYFPSSTMHKSDLRRE